MKLLEIKKVHKYYKIKDQEDFEVLKDINLSFEKGELVSILGESGSGKSTLMNLIGGLDLDFQGDILVEGQSIKKFDETKIDNYRKNKIGFIFQSFNLIPHLSVLDNVTIAMTLSNVSKKDKVARATEILDSVGLKDHMYKKPNQLSGGMKQRVAIARALINNPEVILADEPTGSLDSKNSKQILEIIKKISEEGKLIIMVTHSSTVSAISNRVIYIDDGEIIEDKVTGEKIVYMEEELAVKKEKQNLSFMSAVGLSLKNMREKLGRNTLVALGSSIGIMSVILMLSIGNGITTYIVDTMNENTNPKVVEVNPVDTEVSDTDSALDTRDQFLSGETTTFTAKEIADLIAIDHVVGYDKNYSAMAFADKVKIGEKEIPLQMINTMSKALLKNLLTLGEMPGAGEIMISPRLADKINKDHSKVLNQEMIISHMVEGKYISGTYIISGVYDMGTPLAIMFINFEDIEKLYTDNNLELGVTTIYLYTDNEKYTDGIKEEVKEMGFTGSFQEVIVGMFTKMLDVISYVLAAVAGISLFVSAIMILVVLYISVVERTAEIGLLKAIGARRKDIKRIFVTEAFLLGLAGGIIGVLAAFMIQTVVNIATNSLFGVDVVMMTMGYVLFGIGISIFISIIAGLFPSSKAAKLDPVVALRHE